jgi:Holliday junction resolvase RusA-like endonuclease
LKKGAIKLSYKITLQGKLPSLNEYIAALNSNRFDGAKMKKSIEDNIIFQIRSHTAKIPWVNLTPPVKLIFTWIEPDKKRDLDNICFAKKFILDAFVSAGLLDNDNRKNVCGFEDRFPDPEPTNARIEIEFIDNNTI